MSGRIKNVFFIDSFSFSFPIFVHLIIEKESKWRQPLIHIVFIVTTFRNTYNHLTNNTWKLHQHQLQMVGSCSYDSVYVDHCLSSSGRSSFAFPEIHQFFIRFALIVEHRIFVVEQKIAFTYNVLRLQYFRFITDTKFALLISHLYGNHILLIAYIYWTAPPFSSSFVLLNRFWHIALHYCTRLRSSSDPQCYAQSGISDKPLYSLLLVH